MNFFKPKPTKMNYRDIIEKIIVLIKSSEKDENLIEVGLLIKQLPTQVRGKMVTYKTIWGETEKNVNVGYYELCLVLKNLVTSHQMETPGRFLGDFLSICEALSLSTITK